MTRDIMQVFAGIALILMCLNGQVEGEALVDMKIVDEPSSYGLNHAVSPILQPALQLRVAPANFSGPPHFTRLVGRCFTEIYNDYEYNLCPFHNLTQHEQRNQWNPYNGVLGVWQEWEIEDNKFVSMLMRDGDSCGAQFRSARVSFECGNHSKIVNVSEPQTCTYHLVLRTPLVCHPESMLVYPTLSAELQTRWDSLEGERELGHWTDKGYKRQLAQIFESAGLRLSQSHHHRLQQRAEELKQEKILQGEFTTLEQCKEGFKALQEKVKQLEEEIKTLKNQTAHSEGNLSS